MGWEKMKKDSFEELCRIQCTKQEIKAVFGISEMGLNSFIKREYGPDCTPNEIIEFLRLGGKASLRRIQFEQAVKNPTMAIWLGKQYLGQKDKVEQETTQRVEVVSDMPKEDSNEILD